MPKPVRHRIWTPRVAKNIGRFSGCSINACWKHKNGSIRYFYISSLAVVKHFWQSAARHWFMAMVKLIGWRNVAVPTGVSLHKHQDKPISKSGWMAKRENACLYVCERASRREDKIFPTGERETKTRRNNKAPWSSFAAALGRHKNR